ncbi:NYN domain-containing protein [Leptolyngbya sp. BC1307]|uniref:NYN domain-containing protein n=1 Tax=Leptolyngbya sp. BC1307 TaxID=2029589 RepID=UPI001F0AFD9E|nr:NYN domain-containing protein [Leptolyngbya sp. BC1307]
MAGTPQAILLVDGYNIIGAWADLAALKQTKGFEAARDSLIAALANYSTYEGYETWAVFDAYGQRSPASQEAITPYLSVHYTGYGQTADSYIERACAKFRNDARKFTQRLIVATSDSVHRQTAIGYGAEGISAQQLEYEVTQTGQRVRRRQQTNKRRSRGLLTNLDPAVQARLARMRMGLMD